MTRTSICVSCIWYEIKTGATTFRTLPHSNIMTMTITVYEAMSLLLEDVTFVNDTWFFYYLSFFCFPPFKKITGDVLNVRNFHISMKITVFWNVTPCGMVDIYQYSGGTCCLYFHERRVEVADSFETMTNIYQTA
jgi:hypothetical protein